MQIILRSQEYRLLGYSGGLLFDPRKYGLDPTPVRSSDWYGFSCVFSISEGTLFLNEVRVSVTVTQEFSRAESFPRLFGNPATLSFLKDRLKAANTSFGFEVDEYELPILSYRNLAAKIAYTGSLLIAKEEVSRDVFMDKYQHASCFYADVRELLLRDGQVTQEYDRSSAIAAIREKMLLMESGEQFENREQIRKQIEQCFLQNQKYDYRF